MIGLIRSQALLQFGLCKTLSLLTWISIFCNREQRRYGPISEFRHFPLIVIVKGWWEPIHSLQCYFEREYEPISEISIPFYCFSERGIRTHLFPSIIFWKGDTNPSLPFNNILKGEYDLHFPSSVILKGGYEPISSFQYYSETEMSAYIFPSILFWKGDTSLHQKSSIPLNCYSERGIRVRLFPSV